jgi:hypothetical protein
MLMNMRIVFLLFIMVHLAPGSLFATGVHVALDPKNLEVEQQFALFSQKWIDKVDRNLASRIGKVDFFARDNGYVGRYMQVDRSSVSWTVKQVTNSPRSYIGRLEYLEWTYESVASTREGAANGRFVPVSGRKITEIFQYSQNRWQE